ncbi:MAG: DUF4384 domain-containing protein, partial [bacterium]
MLSLYALTMIAGTGAPFAAPAGMDPDRPAIELWMSASRRYRERERVRVQVETDVDGYLLVLHYDTDGRTQVLFPLDPGDDDRIVAGRRYEVRSDNARDAFIAGYAGTGLVYAAVAAEPWRLDEWVSNGRWDYSRMAIPADADDPERRLTELVQRMAGAGGFDYDVVGYRVYGDRRYAEYGDDYDDYYPTRRVYVYDDYLYCNHWSWRYDGCHRWPWDGGWHVG